MYDVHFLCLDLSNAFDKPSRDLILKSLQCTSDNNCDIMQIATTLLFNTSLSVRIKDVIGKPFELNLRVPQGDSFSPVAFTTTFEMVLQQICPSFPATPSTDIELGLQPEMQYADYADFVSTNHDFLEDVMNVLDTEQPNTIWCATQTRLRGCMCPEKDRIDRRTILLVHLRKSKMCIAGCN